MQYTPSIDRQYSRDNIPNDEIRLPYKLHGLRRAAFMVIYCCIVALSFGFVAYTLYLSPVIGIFGLLSAYFLNNLAFCITHCRFHTSFIELPESKMDILVHHSLIHHYRDVQVYHKTWLETRISYFIDPKAGLLSPVFLGMFPVTLTVSWLLYRQHPVLGMSYFSTVWLAELLQSTIHEWYHNPTSNRKSFYNPVLYAVFTFLEKIGIASTRDHLQHHRHRLHNLHEVEKWLDLYFPLGEYLATRIWKNALTKYEPGKENMTAYVKKLINVCYLFCHVSLSLAYLGLYKLLF